jgi:hypothetical protein
MDLNVTPNREVPKWGETRFIGCWNPDEGVGIYAHIGRFRKDLDMWWMQTVAYLPGGKLAVDRQWGRNPDPAVVGSGNFELRQHEDGWSSRNDGVGELTSSEALSTGVRGASAPSVPVRWDVKASFAAPIWDMYGGATERHDFAGDAHAQGSYRTTGSMTVDGQDHRLDGVGWRDHSSGIRTWDGYGAHHFLLAVMPDWSLHTVMLWGEQGEPKGPLGAFFRDGEQYGIERSEVEPMRDAFGGPDDCRMIVKPAGHDTMTLRVEIVHQCPIIINEHGDNLNGIDWDGESATIVLGEAAARVTAEDGTVGYAFFERGIRRSELERPAG